MKYRTRNLEEFKLLKVGEFYRLCNGGDNMSAIVEIVEKADDNKEIRFKVLMINTVILPNGESYETFKPGNTYYWIHCADSSYFEDMED